MKKENYKAIAITILIVWLFLLTVFVAGDTAYDREMQRLSIASDEANINTHELIIKEIIYIESCQFLKDCGVEE